jgi:AmmeMemoRadiSam system protein B
MIVFAAIAPHPPLSIPGIGSQKDFEVLRRTLEAYETLREGLEKANPDVILVVSPHGHMEPYSFVINSASDLVGSFSDFSLDETMSFKNDLDVAEKIAYATQMDEIDAHLHADFLDHGSLVPLYHLTKNIHPKVIHLSFSMMSYQRHFRYGEVIRNIIENDETRRVAIIASGDLSHRLTAVSPAGFSPNAIDFDRAVIRLLGSNDVASLMGMEQKVIEEAAECGMRSIMIMLGILSGKKYDFQLLSYEYPFGIGHLTARLV